MTTVMTFDVDADATPVETLDTCRILVRHGGVPLREVVLGGTVDRRSRQLLGESVQAVATLRRRLAPPSRAGDASMMSVVICTRDRPDHLEACLTWLAELDPAPLEVIVVDNASRTDRPRKIAERHGCRVVPAPVPGLDRARNVGWRAARGDIVAFLDDDTRVDPSWAGWVARGFDAAGADVVTGGILPAELETGAQQRFEARRGQSKGFEPMVFHRRSNPVGLEPFRLGVGANMAFRRDVLEAVGGFDERLDVGTSTRGGGDLDTLWWAIEQGFTLRYEPAAMVRHVHRRTLMQLVKQMHDNGVGYSAWLAKVEAAVPDRQNEIRRARRMWWAKRHVRGVVRALRWRHWFELVLALAEAEGALHGARRFRQETATHPDAVWATPVPDQTT